MAKKMIHSIWHKYLHVPKIRHVVTHSYARNCIINLSFLKEKKKSVEKTQNSVSKEFNFL